MSFKNRGQNKEPLSFHSTAVAHFSVVVALLRRCSTSLSPSRSLLRCSVVFSEALLSFLSHLFVLLQNLHVKSGARSFRLSSFALSHATKEGVVSLRECCCIRTWMDCNK